MTDWSIEQSRTTYNLDGWGEGYVDINALGHLVVKPFGRSEQGEIDLKTLADDIEKQQMALPVLVRFQDILNDRVNRLCNGFKTAFEKHDVAGNYTAVYPIKVNQQYSVVKQILEHGGNSVGLEAGSKPELMAVLSLVNDGPRTIICNGYKDREYIRLALIARKLGQKIYIVLEKISELDLIIEEAEKIGIEPWLGLRLKLASIGKGKWQNTGGEKAKFGLTAEQILQVVDRLKQTNHAHWIKLLHFHMGSQIASLNDIRTGLAEAAQYFSELYRLGVHIKVLDMGGGMGVDYEGVSSSSEFSVNYQPADYADAVVNCFKNTCNELQVTMPGIITESGRAMTAHHAVLITDVVNAEQHEDIVFEKARVESIVQTSSILQRACSLYEKSISASPVLIYQQINALYFQAQSDFIESQLSIEQRAMLEKIYLACSQRIKKNLTHNDESQQQVLDSINEKLADKIVCNLSVFQSVPDVWGISQVFPIVPLQRLDQQPERRAIVQDLTCDSDGQIEQYVDQYGIETTLPVHQINDDEKYLLGIFMVGAYQEILGDMHNLFGDTNTINVELDENKNYQLCDPESGDTVLELLNYVHFDTGKMMQSYRQQIEQSDLNDKEAKQFLSELHAGLEGYTYLE